MTRIVSMFTKSAALLLTMALLAPAPAMAQATSHTVFGLVQSGAQLIRFNSATPGTIEATITVTGVVTGETLRAIDFRPATGQLFAVGTDATGATVRLYTINLTTGVATGFAPTFTGGVPGTQWGMGFNPTVDRVRLVNEAGENLRMNPNDGTVSGNDTNLTSAAAPTPNVDAVAYDREFAGATQTTLFAINRATNSLAFLGGINSSAPGGPNAGVIADIGPLGVTVAGSTTALEVTTTGTMFAAMRPGGGAESLYTINTATGAATLIGSIGAGTTQLDGMAVLSPSLSLSPGTGTYTSRQRFDLVITANLLGRGLVSGTATFDGADVTPFLAACVITGTTATGAASLRCPNLGGAVIGPGAHTLDVILLLTDGTQVRSNVVWTVVAVAEP